MSDNAYDALMPPTRLDRAVDAAVAERNAMPYTDVDRDADVENALRWAAIESARTAAGRHAAVLPVRVIEDAIKALSGERSTLRPDLLTNMLRNALPEVTA